MSQTSMQTPSRAAIYARATGQHAAARLDDQAQRARAYAAEHGYEVVDFYSDVGTASALPERPGLDALLKNVNEGHVDVVISGELDRLSGDREQLAELSHVIRSAGARLEFIYSGR